MVCKECGAYNAEHLSHCRVCAARLKDSDAELGAEESTEGQDAGRPQRDFVRAPSWPTRPYAGAPDKATYKPSAQDLPDVVEDDGEYEADITELPEPDQPARRPIMPPAAERRPSAASVPAAERTPAIERPAPIAQDRPDASVTEKRSAPAPRKAEEEARFCTECGKPLLPDAPFCAYCGARAALPAEAVKATAKAAAAPVSPQRAAAPIAAKAKPVKPKKVVEDDDFDDFDDDDDADERKKPAKASAKTKRRSHDVGYDDDYDDDEYDDDPDEDEDEYDDEEDEKRGKGGKGTTILFWALIVLLVALIGVFGMYIVKKNYGGDVNNLIASVMGNKTPDVTDADATDPGTVITGTVDASKLGTGTIAETTDATTGTEMYEICIYAPTGSQIKINTVAELESGGVTTIPNNDQMIVRVPRAAFLPNEPQSADTVVITPDIVATTPDGQTMQISIPPVEVAVPALTLTIDQPIGMMATATYKNEPITISGTVDDHTVSVFVNGEQCTVYEGGAFSASYQPTGTETQETVLVEAKKNNYKTASATVTIDPYVVQNMSLVIANDAASLAAPEGSVTLTGTVTAGATLTATCASTNVTCGTAAITETGSFSMTVAVNAVGAYDITLTATQDGYNETTATASVYRAPTGSATSFKKACASLNAAAFAKMADGSITGGDYTFTGTITEIVGSTPYTIVKIQLSSGEEMYLCNRSAKNTLASDDVKKKKTIAGTYAGTYLDTGIPYIWAWYIWNN